MEKTLESLVPAPVAELGLVMQDGGMPVDGFAKALGGEEWPRVAKAQLLTEEV